MALLQRAPGIWETPGTVGVRIEGFAVDVHVAVLVRLHAVR